MQSFCGSIRLARRHAAINSQKIIDFKSMNSCPVSVGSISIKPISSFRSEVGDFKFTDSIDCFKGSFSQTLRKFTSDSPLELMKTGIGTGLFISAHTGGTRSVARLFRTPKPDPFHQSMAVQTLPRRCISTTTNSDDSAAQNASSSVTGVTPRIKFKRLDKTAKHIMQILDKEAVEEVRQQREIPEIKPGYIIQLKLEVPDNKRRVQVLKGIVIARRNAGLQSTFRLRRLVAGVGVESLFPLYSPNIKEMKVLEKKKVRRAKLYYLRDKMNALKK